MWPIGWFKKLKQRHDEKECQRYLKWKASRDASAINWDAVERLAPYGGIRIEDNVLVTETANENLTRTAFATIPH